MKAMPWVLIGLSISVTPSFGQEPPHIIWEAQAGARAVIFSPDGLSMYTGGLQSNNPYQFGNLIKWDVADRSMIFTRTTGLSGSLGLTNHLAVSPDGSRLASGHGSVHCLPEGGCFNIAGGFDVWDAGAGSVQFELDLADLDGLVDEVAYSHDGRFVAFGMYRTNHDEIRIYRLPEYTLHASRPGHGNGTFCVAFSPVENLLATGGWDGAVRLWDVESNQLVRTLDHGTYIDGGYPASLAFSPDGSRLAVAGDGYDLKVTVWDPATGDLIHALTADDGAYGAAASVAISPNGRYLAAGITRLPGLFWEGALRFWNLADGTLVREYVEAPVSGGGSPLVTIAFSPTENHLFAYAYDHRVKLAETDLDLLGGVAALPGESVATPAIAALRAFPNPSSSETTWRYVLSQSGPVEITLFDAMGRLVQVLADGERTSGSHELRFDAARLAAGTYFCRLRARGVTETERLVVTR